MRDTLGQILHDLVTDHAALGRLRVFRENTRKVLEALKRGEIDHVDLTAWSFADSFFAFVVGICDFLPYAASTFPTPRKRHLVPIWLELCCAIHMALSEEPAFQGLTHLLQAGPILTRVKFNIGGCEVGFSHRNTYPRETAVCPDTVRKYFRATDPDALLKWFHGPDPGLVPSQTGLRQEPHLCLGLYLSRCVEAAISTAHRSESAAKRGGGQVKTFSDLDLSQCLLRDDSPTPSAIARGRELNERIEAALLSLGDRDRNLIINRCLCGMSYGEIAEELKLGRADTVRHGCWLALRRLEALVAM